MRLTLRTLLAWLDSLLPPEEQQALAEKVAASPLAPKLVRRIQDVVENAGLGVPRVDARGLTDDANSVAEYLDNCLAADRLEEFERICIESDMHLGEVASCHGVLAEMSRDPAAVAPLDGAIRRRSCIGARFGLGLGLGRRRRLGLRFGRRLGHGRRRRWRRGAALLHGSGRS